MFRAFRIWRDTRYFMKHWKIGKKYARSIARRLHPE